MLMLLLQQLTASFCDLEWGLVTSIQQRLLSRLLRARKEPSNVDMHVFGTIFHEFVGSQHQYGNVGLPQYFDNPVIEQFEGSYWMHDPRFLCRRKWLRILFPVVEVAMRT